MISYPSKIYSRLPSYPFNPKFIDIVLLKTTEENSHKFINYFAFHHINVTNLDTEGYRKKIEGVFCDAKNAYASFIIRNTK